MNSMTNRDKLLKSSEYDVLLRMHNNITQANAHDETPCIMTVIGEPNRNYLCHMYNPDCEKCIQTWLNMEVK